MSFQVKLKALTIALLVSISSFFLLSSAFCPIFAQTAEISAQPQAAQTAEVTVTAPAAEAAAPASQPVPPAEVKPEIPAAPAEAKIEITGELKSIEIQAPAQTAEITATATVQPAQTAEVAAPAVTPAPAPAAEVKPETPAAAPAPAPAPASKPAAPAKKAVKFTATPDTLFITPGSTCDLSKVKLEVKTPEGEIKPVSVDSWSADTGSVNMTTYTPPTAAFKGTAALLANYTYAGETLKTELEIKVRKPYIEERLIVLYMALILAIIILLSINKATGGKNYFIRRIGGLNAIDEAIGRSTEMGKPVLYLTGLSDMSSISTIASISILSYVATKTAEYETSLLVPCCRSLVMNTAREVVKESYLEAGKPDAYNAENIKYITDDQFGFVSGVDGIMLREKPAANFYLGHFMAESLIYAETGNSIGAIQIAGTSEFSQIPFFVAACDYCLIGEELFAASAYLSRKPKDVGTLRGQDIAKLAIMVIVIIGVVLETVSVINPGMASSLGLYKSFFQTK
ncbi:MAG: hypothetical protein A2008_14075 [Candidatus Wallbacteria bacterium GWC2_49_35]|uniref:DUF6754 domain-containing protein n=1 Tax=Candidatus Wallbacteria bacterium GWC2_49_35 TaxID=1817813 RepID=A0A1F7WLX3_9BACT|nr:MAG: hypothetical protein A2008_14075 [Candidatus Wallbacteria bacterium GWC2_49_35]